MRQWIWQNLSMELPDDWEMLQFAKDPARGRCAFADRHRFRLEFNWRRIDGPPDMDRVISDYRAKLENEDGITGVRPTNSAGWPGIENRRKDKLNTRFGNYFSNEKYLVELVFLWPAEKDTMLQRAILGSVREIPPAEGGHRRWKAFGMELLVRGGLSLSACTVQPAYAEMTFADIRTGDEDHFSRLGMLDEWFGGSVGNWLKEKRPDKIITAPGEPQGIRDHQIESATGRKRAPGLRGALRHRLEYRAFAWICPADRRLYSVSRLSSEATGPDGTASVPIPLSCCECMELPS